LGQVYVEELAMLPFDALGMFCSAEILSH